MTFARKAVVHYQSKWSEKDYKRARIGPWIQLAADRFRFQRRIKEFDSKFGYIFSDRHREYIHDLIEEFILHDMIVDLFKLKVE